MTDIFAHGIPIASLGDRARVLAEQLDESPLIPRDDPAHLESQHLERDEAAAAMRFLDNWSDPEDRATLTKLAAMLGIETATPATLEVATENVDLVDDSLVAEIDLILTSITETTPVGVVEASDNHLEVELDGRVCDVEVLDYQHLSENRIAVDIDANFFCRTAWNGQALVSVGRDNDGGRYLYGIPRDGRSPLPKNTELWLHHAGTGTTLRIETDGEGRFAAALPDGMAGRATFVRLDKDRGVGAQIELPAEK